MKKKNFILLLLFCLGSHSYLCALEMPITIGNLSAPKNSSNDMEYVLALQSLSKDTISILGDLYWAYTCSNSFDGIEKWQEMNHIIESSSFIKMSSFKALNNDEYINKIYKIRNENCK